MRNVTDRRKLLTQLRRVAEAAPEERLHMRAYCEDAECGTAYCLAGWARIDEWFIKHTSITHIFSLDTEGFVRAAYDTYDQSGVPPIVRLGEMFDIGTDAAHDLFGGQLLKDSDPHAVTKAEVLAQIDRLLAGQDTEPYAAVPEMHRK